MNFNQTDRIQQFGLSEIRLSLFDVTFQELEAECSAHALTDHLSCSFLVCNNMQLSGFVEVSHS